MSTLVPGKLVTPSVRLLEPLGSGGMAMVWVAEHLTLHTRVVVKVLTADLAASEEARARFSREAAAAAAVKSPHVVQVFDHGIIDNNPFIVMELLEGEDLRVRLERQSALMLAEVEAVVNQTCKALTQAHRAGVVHRDIKPDNIFLCKSDDDEIFVKLLDFGIAKTDDAHGLGATRTGAVMGTPYYMSPEQVLGAKVDFRTDLWSLAVVAFEAMTGTKAFDGQTLGALAIAITHQPIPIPSQRNPLLPPSVDEWFARACAREPTSRFPSAKEMASAFRTASTGAPVTGSSLPRMSVTTPLGTKSAPSLPTTAPMPIASPPMTTTPLQVHPTTTPPIIRTTPMAAHGQPQQMMSTTTSPVHGTVDTKVPMTSSRTALALVAIAVLVLGAGIAVVALSMHHAAAQSVVASPSIVPSVTASIVETTVLSSLSAVPSVAASISSAAPRATHTHTTPSAVAPHASAPPSATTAQTTAKPNCDPPYTVNDQGDKIYKKECMK